MDTTGPRFRAKEDRATTGERVTAWLELREKQGFKASTAQGYREILRRRFFETTGKAGRLRSIPLTQVTRRDVSD